VHQTDQWLNGNLQNATQISGKNMALKTGALQALRSAALSGRAEVRPVSLRRLMPRTGAIWSAHIWMPPPLQ
jgi:hypothetical protein